VQVRQPVFVPALISQVVTLVPGELRKIALRLPPTAEVDNHEYPIRDAMRPGTAFLVRPYGGRTKKLRRRMYTRSNESGGASRELETIINRSVSEKADTSLWWQSEEVEQIHQTGETVDVRVDLVPEGAELVVYENSQHIERNNLRLETDEDWPGMKILALAFSTGVTPFLSYLRYMRRLHFGKTINRPGGQLTLILSVRNPDFLMDHQELQELAEVFPDHFQYIPVFTRDWPTGWTGPRGRILKAVAGKGGGTQQIDLEPLTTIIPNLSDWHIRLCGSAGVRNQLVQGFNEQEIHPQSFRAEVW